MSPVLISPALETFKIRFSDQQIYIFFNHILIDFLQLRQKMENPVTDLE